MEVSGGRRFAGEDYPDDYLKGGRVQLTEEDCPIVYLRGGRGSQFTDIGIRRSPRIEG